MNTNHSSKCPSSEPPAANNKRCEAVKAWGTLAIATVLVILCMAALALPFALFGGDRPTSGKQDENSLSAYIIIKSSSLNSFF